MNPDSVTSPTKVHWKEGNSKATVPLFDGREHEVSRPARCANDEDVPKLGLIVLIPSQQILYQNSDQQLE